MDKIVNPYIAGAPVVETRMFFGREDVFDWIERSLGGQYADHILVVHGQRRVGKTSVLKQLGNRLPKKYVPVFFDLQGRTHTTLDRFLWWLAREITRVLKQDHGLAIPPPDREVFAQDIEYFENRFLPELRPLLGDEHILLLTFDEFDNLEESEVKDALAQPLIDHLRRMMGRPNLNFIFSIGSSGRKLENMQAAYTEFFKTALYKKISFLSQGDAHRLITMPVEGIIEYEQDAVQNIYELVSGHPYFVQLVCHELFSRCQKTEQRIIRRADVDSVLDDVVERGTVNLKFVWDEAADLEKWSLASLVNLEGKRDARAVADFLTRQRVRFNQQALDSALLHLREKDVLTEDNRFVNQLLQIWLKKNRPIEQVREELTEVNPIANRYIEIGLEFKDAGQYQKAVDSFREALEVDAGNLQAQINIALTYLAQKNVDNAIREFEKALTMDEEDVVSRAGLCDAYLAQGDEARAVKDLQAAIQAYQKVLNINAEHTEARGRVSEINREYAENALAAGKDEEALSFFAEALKYLPEDESLIARVEEVKAEKKAKVLAAQLARAEKEAAAKHWEQAIAALNEAQQTAPEDASIPAKIADVKERQLQDRLAAIRIRAEQAEKSSRWDVAIVALKEYLTLRDDASVQKRLADLIEAKHAAWIKAVLTRAEQSAANQKWDEAFAALNEVLRIESDNAEIKTKVEEIRKARQIFELNAILKRAEQAAQAGRWDEAIDALNGGLSAYADNETLQAKLAEIRKSKREARLKSALRLADTAAQAGKWDAALNAVNEILAVEPENLDFKNKLVEIKKLERESKLNSLRAQAQSFAKAEKFDEALAAWNEYLALAPDDAAQARAEVEAVKKAQEVARRYAEALNAYNHRNYDKAIELFKEVVSGNYNYKNASHLLAEAIELKRAARKWWQNKWLWGMVIGLLVLLVGWFGLQYALPLLAATPAPTSKPLVVAPSATLAPVSATETLVIAATAQPAPVVLPYRWVRLDSGQSFARDVLIVIVEDPADPGVLYVGTSNAGVFKSIDGGRSWQPASNGLKSNQIAALFFSKKDNASLLAFTPKGWYASLDGANSWSPAFPLAANPPGEFVVPSPIDANTYYAFGNQKIYRTTDNGGQWEALSQDWGDTYLSTVSISATEKYIYAATSGYPGSRLAHVFDTQTSQWSEVLFPGGCSVFADPLVDEVAYCGVEKGVFKTADAGKTWSLLGNVNAGFVKAILVSKHNPATFYAGGQGLFTSADRGLTWTQINNGLPSSPIDLRIDPINPAVLYAQDLAGIGAPVFRSADAGKTWTVKITNSCNLGFDGEGRPVCGHKTSLDSGEIWVENTTPVSQHTFAIGSNFPFSGTVILQDAQGKTALISQDKGATWSETAGVMREMSMSFFFDHNQGQVIYALESRNAYRSDDFGNTWSECADFDFNLSQLNARIAVDYGDNRRLLLASGNQGILLSADGCQSWQPSNTGLNDASARTIAADPLDPNIFYAGTDSGAYISLDGGATWNQINDGLLGATVVYSIAVNKDGKVYAATPYGIFTLEKK